MKLLFIVLLISTNSICQIIIPAKQPLVSNTTVTPEPFFCAPKSTTEITLWITGSAATSYQIERSVNSDYSSSTDLASEGYNGTDLSYVDDGLTINTVYYYRARALYTNLNTSEWATTSTTTFSVMPSAFYLPAAAIRGVDNEFADTEGVAGNEFTNFFQNPNCRV